MRKWSRRSVTCLIFIVWHWKTSSTFISAKAEEYDDHAFVVARMPPVLTAATKPNENGTTLRLETEQLGLFVGNDFVVTFQERPGDCFDIVRDRLKVPGRLIRNSGADYLAYALLDAVVDAYFPVLDKCGQILDELDDEVTGSTSASVMSRVHDAKASVRLLRRAIWPHREMIHELIEGHTDLITESTNVYLRDVYDHTIQVIDILETYRETCSDLRDFYMSTISNRMNEVMKVLTIIATIFIPLGFIAGVYGMNFDHEVSPYNMPELHWFFGYPLALSMMLAVAAGMLLFFRWKGWLGSRDAAHRGDDRRKK